MSDVSEKLTQIEENVMSGLKDFQRATVERIDYLFRNGQRRVLVSDEVGLGKTLIARGTIVKLAILRKEQQDDLVKVVYICSNSAIAEQNLNKLRITSELRADSISSSRLSMQHLNIFNQEHDSDVLNRYIQLIPLTPDTSFRVTYGTGTVWERALMFAFLKRIPALNGYIKELETAMTDSAVKAWEPNRDYYEKKVLECNEKSGNTYLPYMISATEKGLNEVQANGITIMAEVIKMCEEIRANGNNRSYKNIAIGHLRVMYSKISLDKLEPDLVIMDEFQRFKYLINSDPETETGMLAQKFFGAEDVKMLMLSATPYKMYSTLEEIDETQVDEHYSEFLDVMSFLNIGVGEQAEFKEIWNNYSVQLREFSKDNTTLLAAKTEAEDAMYKKVCRTERISATENADIIDTEAVKPVSITEQDVISYISAQKLLDEIGASYHVPVDYIKSTPYLLSFMKDYQLKRNIENYYKAHPDLINSANKRNLWLKSSDIDLYKPIPSGNARLDVLKQHAFANKAELLLWVPPSLPYYNSGGVYKDAVNFSKILVFSSWEMVPRMIAGMVSYEAERKTVGKLAANAEETIHYFYSENAGENSRRKRFPSPRLNFAAKDNQANAMSLFCLVYPSDYLTKCYNPIECLNNKLTLKDIENKIRNSIKADLSKIEADTNSPVDKRWYYITSLLLDDEDYVNSWFKGFAELPENKEEAKKETGFDKHISTLAQLYRDLKSGEKRLGNMPDDLIDVLTDMAIASPAICINRTYRKYQSDFNSALASQFAQIFINRMNTPESTAVVEICYGKSEEAHWRNLISYCKDGNFQAMLDEYAHLITNGIDNNENIIQLLHNTITESMSIRTTLYGIDTFPSFKKRMLGGKGEATNLRTHFAVAFTKGEGDKSADRKKVVRNAFNSPFRPFVLASTSIGQEGLDFHYYCRKIVHWNLPSNPIDIEQREGRINRFECLALRQNIAKRYGDAQFVSSDVWREMFEIATKDTEEHHQHSSDLIPYWGLPKQDGMIKIERIVPQYPFSRDISSYERLIKILSLYRLTLGQARQEELLEYIIDNSDENTDLHELFINLSPLYKNKT
ncbi:MAG: DEAD/DEAH box helicase family protein [Clostridia bacterium]|nr:DEAD/DEAH box helicase family protein [Clostridia bacterium]